MAKYAKNEADGGYYLTKPGDDGYHTHGRGWMDILGRTLHNQGYSFDVSKQAWMPPPDKAPGAPGDPNNYGGGTGGRVNSTGGTNTAAGGIPPTAGTSPWPWIACGVAALALVYVLAKK